MVLLLAAAAAALAGSPAPSRFSDARPPAPYQGPATVVVEMTDQAGIDRICHGLFGKPPAGLKTEGCQIGNRIIVPNPCSFPESDRYAAILCHELGHANGWTSMHEREPSRLAEQPSAPAGLTVRRPAD